MRLRASRRELMLRFRRQRARRDPAAGKTLLQLDAIRVLEEDFARYASDLEATLTLAREGPPEVYSDLLRAHARFWTIRGGQRIAFSAIEHARRLAPARDPVRAGALDFVACHVASCLGQPDQAARYASSLFTHARSARPSRDGLRLMALASLSRGLGLVSADQALDSFEDAIDFARRARADRTLGLALGNRAMAWIQLGRRDRALSSFRTALAVLREVGDRLHVAQALGDIALCAGRTSPTDLLGLARETQSCGDHHTTARLLLELLGHETRSPSARSLSLLARVWSMLARVDAPDLETRARELSLRWERHRIDRRLLVARDGSRFALGGNEIQLATRKALPLLMKALVTERLEQPGRSLSVAEMFELGWPEERALAHSAAARVYMAVRALRLLGLGEILITRPQGYHLDPDVEVGWDG
jgi:tetratricopeptide (TPR) repeat protein